MITNVAKPKRCAQLVQPDVRLPPETQGPEAKTDNMAPRVGMQVPDGGAGGDASPVPVGDGVSFDVADKHHLILTLGGSCGHG